MQCIILDCFQTKPENCWHCHIHCWVRFFEWFQLIIIVRIKWLQFVMPIVIRDCKRRMWITYGPIWIFLHRVHLSRFTCKSRFMCLDNQVHLRVVWFSAGNFCRGIELLAIRFRGEVNAGQVGSEDPIGAAGPKKFTVSASPFSGQDNVIPIRVLV